MDTREQIERIKQALGKIRFTRALEQAGLYPLHSRSLEILQMNITRRCNLSCKHCHVESGSERTEEMSPEILGKCLEIAASPEITTIDITGGAPEMHPLLPWFLEKIAQLGKRTVVRSNAVILLDDPHRGFVDLYARECIELVISMPAPGMERTDRQRGSGIFEKIITAMRLLNSRGYGVEGTGLVLDLVHNPAGAYIAGSQQALEIEYKRKLSRDHGVHFTRLFCLNNCPIGRYLDFLIATDNLDEYMQELVRAFNPSAAENVMCRSTLSVGWDGTLYDCDFNQMLALSVNHGVPNHIQEFDSSQLAKRHIMFEEHCFACTAGAGSSCQGATT